MARTSAETQSRIASAGSLVCYVARTMAWLSTSITAATEQSFTSMPALGCEGIVSKRLGSPYRAGRSAHWLKIKNPDAPAVRREAEEDWGKR